MSAHLCVDEAQILRFSGPGPRYTSYPTVPAWSEAVGADEARAALQRASEHESEPLSLYVHLPFCARLCLFCGCTVEITQRADKSYSTQVYTACTIGATRLQQGKVIEILTQE